MVRTQKRYSKTFKRKVLARVAADPSALVAIARECGMPTTTLRSWRKQDAAKEATDEAPQAGVRVAIRVGILAAESKIAST